MTEQNKQKSPLVAVLISAIIVAIIVVWAVVKPKSAEPTYDEQLHKHESSRTLSDQPATASSAENAGDSSNMRTGLLTGLKPSLRDVIQKAQTWGPVFESWFGKPAPDFSLADLTGKQHTLSDYQGKYVVIIFWATWCGPCRLEIPHLIELRNTMGQDKLAMLAISNEGPALLKKYVAQQKINYTVFSNQEIMPTPYNLVNAIPCSFFIDQQGKIKLATIGMLSLTDIKAILQAK
jgi:peroxiredoxin